MNFKRIGAVFLRYIYCCLRLDALADLFYWPTVDILLWGLTSRWIQSEEAHVSSVAVFILTGLVFWQAVWRASFDVTVNLLQEFWSRNLANLFSTPLKLSEWMAAAMLIGLLKIGINMIFTGALVYLLYTLNVFEIGWVFLPYVASLSIFGWTVGYLSGGIMLYFGQRFQMLAWMMPFIFAPFSAVFYPLAVLPEWAQKVAHCLPTSYIFEGMREVLTSGFFSMHKLVMSLVLNGLYLCLSMLFFRTMFEKSREKGLARLE